MTGVEMKGLITLSTLKTMFEKILQVLNLLVLVGVDPTDYKWVVFFEQGTFNRFTKNK